MRFRQPLEAALQLSELSREGGVPIPTIKYYLREGILRPGTRVSANRAGYDESHLRRLRLIRALVTVGELPIATVRDVLGAVDDPALSLHEVLGVAHHALAGGPAAPAGSDEMADARAEVDRWLDDLGWRVKDDAPDRYELAATLATLRDLGWKVGVDVFSRYAATADELAAWELSQTPVGDSRERTVEAVVVGTVLFGAALTSLRRLAEEHRSAARFGG
jgi:DNA-binding transcriptional MerR regulator